ncbi:MAG TPA: Gfo/Idh/MocA family oxidoreductase [Gammaproteobacteria bacterium]|nr:Gfo/Idh/MocA family oxidoreductase [Gammaproteobacteria bacterium]
MSTISWGILGTARIATEKVIPPMQATTHCRVEAIASRDASRARTAASELGIPKAFGSYEDLLADPDIEAVYIPLPNDMHVAWATAAAEAGKHVLCEKPIALDASGAAQLLAVRDRTGVRIQEAFMVHTHPQWVRARDLVRDGDIGRLQAVQGFFSYHNDNPRDIRNVKAQGGGGMLDIGCYPIKTGRFVTGLEPTRVASVMEWDPGSGIDRLGSVILDFGGVQATFTYGTQLVPHQRMEFFGDRGRLTVEIPFNAPPDRPTRLYLDDGSALGGRNARTVEIETCDQYGVEADEFSRAILENAEPPIPLEDAVANMRVIDAAFRAAASGTWERP